MPSSLQLLRLPLLRFNYTPHCLRMLSTSRPSTNNTRTVNEPEVGKLEKGGKTTGSGAAEKVGKGGGPSLSASLILLSPLPKPAEDGYDYRVLLLQRHALSSTYESAYVFPGGNVDPIDSSPSFHRFLTPSPSSTYPPNPYPPSSAFSARSPETLRLLEATALRETFEESGLLLLEKRSEAWESLGEEERGKWRERVGARGGGGEIVRLLEELDKKDGKGEVRMASGRLREWARWVTPESLPRRYDTTFFISLLPPSSSPSTSSASPNTNDISTIHTEHVVTSDGVETTSAIFLTPGEAIRRALLYTKGLLSSPRSGGEEGGEGILVHPPQFNLIAELAANHRSYRSLLASSSSSSSFSTTSSAGRVSSEWIIAPRRVATYLPRLIFVPSSSSPSSDAGGGKTRLRRAMALPGDEYYDAAAAGPEVSEKMRGGDGDGKRRRKNRTYVLPPEKGKAGLTVQGVHRHGMEEVLGEGWGDTEFGDVLVDEGEEKRRAKL